MRRVVILGGGYAGLHAFSALRSRLRSSIARGEAELILVSRDNYHTYHGWTGEVMAGDLPVDSTLTALEPLLGQSFVQGDVVAADIPRGMLTVRDGDVDRQLRFDQLLIAAGSVDPFDRIPGLAEHGWCVKNSRDMQKLAGHLDALEDAISDTRNVVVIGGGLAGVETASALATRFGRIGAGKVKVHLVSSSEALLPALRPDFNHIAETATRTLSGQSVQIHAGSRVERIGKDQVELADGRTIASDLSVVTAGVSFSVLPGTETLPRNAAGQIIVDEGLRVPGFDNVWVAGDIAAARHPVTGEPCPTNALWAMKQGDCVGRNIALAMKGKPARRFGFRGLGQAAGLAGQRGITELFGMQFTGRLAWIIRILFFAWYMPSRRGALSVLSQLSRQVWNSMTGTVHGRRATGVAVAKRPVVQNLSSRPR